MSSKKLILMGLNTPHPFSLTTLYCIYIYVHWWNHRSDIHMGPERVWQEGNSGQECHTGSGLELDFLFVP